MIKLLTPLLLASFAIPAGAVSCGELEREFSKGYALVETQCKEHSECTTGYYNWDPCAVQAAAKEQSFQDYDKTRSELHRLCGYVVKPCAAVTEPAYCVQGRCALHSEVLRRFPVFRFSVAAVKEGEFKLVADTGVRCITAPCPSTRETHSGKIKNHRFSVPAAALLESAPPAEKNRGPLAGGGGRPQWILINSRMTNLDVAGWLKRLPDTIKLEPR